MGNKKLFIIFGVVFLAIIAGIFAVYEYFSNPAKKKIEISDIAGKTEEIAQPEKIAEENNVEVQEEELAIQQEIPEKNSWNPEPLAKNNENINIINKLVSFGYQSTNGRTIDTIIIHSSYDALGDEPYEVGGVIAEYKIYGVSPHYLISRDGKIYRLVEDKNIAYHAGTSRVPDGRTNVNSFSLGIEMLNTKNDNYTDAQYKALNNLLPLLKDKYEIKYVLGHNQIAPGRKDDPWNFDWNKIHPVK